MEEKDQDMNIAVLNTEMKNISEKINTMDNSVNLKLNSIEEKVTKTNGRVQSLELYRAMLVGGLAVLTTLFVPVFLKVLSDWVLK